MLAIHNAAVEPWQEPEIDEKRLDRAQQRGYDADRNVEKDEHVPEVLQEASVRIF